jgi:hypothetical protein
MQTFLFKLGHYAQNHSVQVIMIGLVALIVFALGLYKARLETNVENLWMEGRLPIQYSSSYSATHVGQHQMY